jgi:hypothetical protein
MSLKVFFSWQSDRNTKEGRNFIEKALRAAVDNIKADAEVEEAQRDLEVDKDTQGVPGTPPIFPTILDKIDKATVFVADITICGTRGANRPTPNPNVLIEYGYALKHHTHSRIINVMNAAYGAPPDIQLPFDLQHVRFPIKYELREDADEAARLKQRTQLVKRFELALRDIFKSADYKATLPKPPAFIPKTPMDGEARFRSAHDPLGNVVHPLESLGLPPQDTPSILLCPGPACWFRIFPAFDPGRKWRTQELLPRLGSLTTLKLARMMATNEGVRGFDGVGHFSRLPYESARSLIYAFKTGELWIIDAWISRVPDYVELHEFAWIEGLDKCASWLDNIGCTGPYKFIAGMEGIKGRRLTMPAQQRGFGVSVADSVVHTGTFSLGESASDALEPFFGDVWDAFGMHRQK